MRAAEHSVRRQKGDQVKKVLIVLGVIFLVLVLIISGIGVFTWYKSSKYENTAVPYIKAAIPELSKWDIEITKEYMAPEVKKEISDEDLNKVIKYLSKLGSLVSIEKPSFTNIYAGATLDSGKKTFVTYTINALYENGNAVITITLLDLGGSFNVYKLNINSMALAE